jgi:hypothetical protein
LSVFSNELWRDMFEQGIWKIQNMLIFMGHSNLTWT